MYGNGMIAPDITQRYPGDYPARENAICKCECCGEEIFDGEEIYNLPLNGGVIHEGCLNKCFKAFKTVATRELFL